MPSILRIAEREQDKSKNYSKNISLTVRSGDPDFAAYFPHHGSLAEQDFRLP
jgi:hypothetical protein